MSAVLGFEFYQGLEVPKPVPIDHTETDDVVRKARKAWMKEIEQAIRDDDAWGVMVQFPNMDVELLDVHPDSVYRATGRGGNAYLLLARESRS